MIFSARNVPAGDRNQVSEGSVSGHIPGVRYHTDYYIGRPGMGMALLLAAGYDSRGELNQENPTMTFIPWRLKNFISEHFPLLYHLLRNAGAPANSVEHWDAALALSWDDPIRHWPGKNALIASLVPADAAVLDVGCGNGSVLRYLQSQGFTELHGLEISRYAIRRLNICGIKMHNGVLPSIPLPDASFDAVIASQVLEHIIRRRRFMTEIRRVLKPGGRAFIFVPDNCLGPIDEKEHVIRYNIDSLRKFVSKYFLLINIESIRDPNHPMPILFAHVQRQSEL